MEKDPTLSPEYTPIAHAEFLDHLAPEYEALWTQLTSEESQGKNSYTYVMRNIWASEAMPQVFRDRAILMIFGGTATQEQLDPDRSRMQGADKALRLSHPTQPRNIMQSLKQLSEMTRSDTIPPFGYRPENAEPDTRPSFLSPEFAETLQRAFDKQQQTGEQLINPACYLPMWCELRHADLLDGQQLQTNLDSLQFSSFTDDQLSAALTNILHDQAFLLYGGGEPGQDPEVRYQDIFHPWAWRMLQALLDRDVPPGKEFDQLLPRKQDPVIHLTRALETGRAGLWQHFQPYIEQLGWDTILQRTRGYPGHVAELKAMGDIDTKFSMLAHFLKTDPTGENLLSDRPYTIKEHYLKYLKWLEGATGTPAKQQMVRTVIDTVSEQAARERQADLEEAIARGKEIKIEIAQREASRPPDISTERQRYSALVNQIGQQATTTGR